MVFIATARLPLVPAKGFEPSRILLRRILSALCLPISSHRHIFTKIFTSSPHRIRTDTFWILRPATPANWSRGPCYYFVALIPFQLFDVSSLSRLEYCIAFQAQCQDNFQKIFFSQVFPINHSSFHPFSVVQ